MKSARRPVSDTSGPRCCTPLSRSQLPSWLHSELQAASRKIDLIVIHCTDTRATQSYTVEQLQRDHERRGFGKYPGYHLYIRRDGTLYNTRPLQLKGCHVAGYNAHSIGVCYEGGKSEEGRMKSEEGRMKSEDNRTEVQKVVLREVLLELRKSFPEARIVGHHDLNPAKACPCFDARREYASLTT